MKANLLKPILVAAAIGATSFIHAETAARSSQQILEEAIYLQEAKGDLAAAIERYRLIVTENDANQALAAEAQYRLAACLLEQKDVLAAAKAFEDLVSKFPNESKWVEAALKHLPKEFTPSTTPWKDNERITLDWRLPSGDPIGFTVYRTRQQTIDGKTAWKLESQSVIGGASIQGSVTADGVRFLPLSATFDAPQTGAAEIDYDAGSIATTYARSGETKRTAVSGIVYDNEQATHLMRQFPVEVGFSTNTTLFVALTGLVAQVTNTIEALETVDTKIGPIDCYRVRIDILGQTQRIWISSDERRLITKLQVGGIECVLSDYRIAEPEDTIDYANDVAGISIRYPESYHPFAAPTSKGLSIARIFFMNSKEPTSPFLDVVRKSAAELDSAYQEVLASHRTFIDFAMVKGGERSFEIDGVPARSFIAEHTYKGAHPKRYMHVVFVKDDLVYNYTARSDPERFEQLRPQFAAIVESIRFNR